MRTPGVLTGALAGALLAAPLAALLYLGQQLVGLPFLPFDLFDWLARRLPGSVVTFGIDAMVAALGALGVDDLSAAAKRVEQALAIVVFLGAGAVAGGLVAALLRVRRSRPNIEPVHAEVMDRRKFVLRLGGAAAVITVVGAGAGVWLGRRREQQARSALEPPWSERNPLPNADAAPAPVPGTRPELTPVEDHYRVDINTRAPVVDEAEWRLRVSGLVERPLELTLADLRSRWRPVHRFITLSCISNPVAGDLIGTTRWTGVPLREVLAAASPLRGATHLRLGSVDGFHEDVALEEVLGEERIMLTWAWDGLPLTPEHGFPLRLYRPDRYGMKQPKWLESIEVIDHPEDGYWVQRGWNREARMKATSVVDVVATDRMLTGPGGVRLVPIGGIAHAGARGISRVELSLNGGPWQPAQLREPLSPLTWVLWRYDWPFQPGEHTLAVRCIDGVGRPQSALDSPVHPDGAAGLHRRQLGRP